MNGGIASVSFLVREYDEALAFFTDVLRFEVAEDRPLSESKRWVVVRPRHALGTSLVLGKAATPEQAARVGDQTGGRVCFFLHTDDFWREHRHLQAHGVRFTEHPREESYGTVVVFLDLYGNKWDLVQHHDASPSPTALAANRSMPVSAVIPVLLYADLPAATEWLCRAFGFTPRLRIGRHRVQIDVAGGAGALVVAQGADHANRASGSGEAPSHSIMVRVADVDAHHEHAEAAGARIVSPPTTQPYGERQYSALDLADRAWTFSQTVGDVDPATWGGELATRR